MDKKPIPVIDIMDFEGVTIDAVKWNSEVYTVMFNFWKTISVDTVKTIKPEQGDGMILCTHISGQTLEECWNKIQLVLKSDILEGTDVYLYGSLWSEDGEIIYEIDWSDYCDESTAELLRGQGSMEIELLKYSPINVHPISNTIH